MVRLCKVRWFEFTGYFRLVWKNYEEVGSQKNIGNVLRKRQLKMNPYQSVFRTHFSSFFQIALCKFCAVWGSNFIFSQSWWTRTSAQRPEAKLACATSVSTNVEQFSNSFDLFATNLLVMGRLSWGVSPMHRSELYRDARGLGGLLVCLLFGSREGSSVSFVWLEVFSSYIFKRFSNWLSSFWTDE